MQQQCWIWSTVCIHVYTCMTNKEIWTWLEFKDKKVSKIKQNKEWKDKPHIGRINILMTKNH